MHQKSLVKQIWLESGLYGDGDPKLGAFFRYFEAAKTDCWSELVQEVREHYPEYKVRLIAPIWDTGDKLLRLNVIRALAPDRDDEVAIFQNLIQRPNTRGNDWELQALMRVAQRRGLSVE